MRGTLDWVPPPDPYPWWVAATLGALLVGARGLLPAGTGAGSRALRGVGAVLALGGVAAVALVLGRELDAGAQGVGGVLLGLARRAALAAADRAGRARGRRLGAGPTARRRLRARAGRRLPDPLRRRRQPAVLSRAVAPVPWSGGTARVLLTGVLIAGVGALGAGLLRLHAAARAAVPDRRRPGPT